MKLRLQRYSSSEESTIGLLFVNGSFECYTLEDPHQNVKIPGKTRIPAGSYDITLRNEGGMVVKYNQRFAWHRGMLWLKDVPNFQYVYIHIGNKNEDTEGCILVAMNANNNKVEKGFISNSIAAYTRLYQKIIAAIDNNEEIILEIIDD